MQMPERRATTGLGWIECRIAATGCIGSCEACLGFGEERVERLLDFVEAFAGRGLVGTVDLAESLLSFFEPAVFRPRETRSARLRGSSYRQRRRTTFERPAERIQIGNEVGQGHDRNSSSDNETRQKSRKSLARRAGEGHATNGEPCVTLAGASG